MPLVLHKKLKESDKKFFPENVVKTPIYVAFINKIL